VEENATIFVRTLGTFAVTRADGSEARIHEWKTGKTRDLLRILALNVGRPVSQTRLVELLWPNVPDARRRNSLRSAASQIRTTLRTNSVLRRPNGLVLVDAWVDTLAFRGQAQAAHLHGRAGRHEEVVELAHAADDLYGGDFQADDCDSEWARSETRHLREIRHELLCDTAASYLQLGQPFEARDLATEAIELNPSSETAHRLLMCALADLGEITRALRVFESYRSHLADELGADPSYQTRELHLRLLRGWDRAIV
jgi:DNA-binding SARP family transcriptional activator